MFLDLGTRSQPGLRRGERIIQAERDSPLRA